MTLYERTVPPYRDMMKTLSGLIDKAEAHGGDALLSAALAPDMHPLATQIRFVANMPGEALSKLAGVEGLHWEQEDPASLAAGKERLAQVDGMLAELSPDAFCADEEQITLNIPNGMQFQLSAANYVRDWALPQFYFHVSAAYMILRNKGVQIGKVDYVPHMVRHMTKGPQAG